MKRFVVRVGRHYVERLLSAGTSHHFKVVDGVPAGSRLVGIDAEEGGTRYGFWFEHDDDSAREPKADTATMMRLS